MHDLKQSQSSESSQLHSVMVDPAVNIMFTSMKKQLKEYKEKLEHAQNDLSAWKFTPDRWVGGIFSPLGSNCTLALLSLVTWCIVHSTLTSDPSPSQRDGEEDDGKVPFSSTRECRTRQADLSGNPPFHPAPSSSSSSVNCREEWPN